MYNNKQPQQTSIVINKGYQADRLEEKIERMIRNNEKVGDTNTKLVYTEKAEGVKPEYDPRTDKWEVAVEATDKVSKQAVKGDSLGYQAKKNMEKEKEGEAAKGGSENATA